MTLQFLPVSWNAKKQLWKQKQCSFPFWQSSKSEVKQKHCFKNKSLYKSRKLLLTGSSVFSQIFLVESLYISSIKHPAHPMCVKLNYLICDIDRFLTLLTYSYGTFYEKYGTYNDYLWLILGLIVTLFPLYVTSCAVKPLTTLISVFFSSSLFQIVLTVWLRWLALWHPAGPQCCVAPRLSHSGPDLCHF